jgi:hypothetical protein
MGNHSIKNNKGTGRLLGVKLNFSITLWKKEYVSDSTGGQTIEWKQLGNDVFWAHISPAAQRFPVQCNGQEYYWGAAYDVIVRNDPVAMDVERILWDEKELFSTYSPKVVQQGYLMIRTFQWKKKEARENLS